MIGAGWCIIIQADCEHLEGQGPDGMVKCSCEGECPFEKDKEE
ncbi:hypothetical protein LCGC14_1037300 [marine sediment metagenome]|uniref:Uncharacterized protein n=1 Tax=marine sediment metagenome TaxID=412755 RepID=A0A0F9MXG0_9ZZZZ